MTPTGPELSADTEAVGGVVMSERLVAPAWDNGAMTDWEALAEQLYDALVALDNAYVRDTVATEVAAAIAAYEAALEGRSPA